MYAVGQFHGMKTCFHSNGMISSCAQLPVLSTGEGLGSRVCLCDGVSVKSGRWRVEECGGEGERVRRLVFVDTSDLVQTEVRLRPGTRCVM